MSEIGVVVIGRNEGARLVRCLKSVSGATPALVYVDSASSDESIKNATDHGADVVSLDATKPMTAARARNAGFRRLLETFPNVDRVQFVDGDCEVLSDWIKDASSELDNRPGVAVVCGRLWERNPEQSKYNRLLDMDWNAPPGETDACGGIAMFRVSAFGQSQGFNESLIAGEEPEFCVRLRANGWKVFRLPIGMVLHDAEMTRFGQWWRRAIRTGHAYAEVTSLHGKNGLRNWTKQVRSNWFWAVGIPLLVGAFLPINAWISLALLIAYPLLGFRVFRGRIKRGDSSADARLYAIFNVISKFPMAIGQAKYYTSRIFGHTRTLIEYKNAASTVRVGYLTDQYPHVSKSFIRKEIEEVESKGIPVFRVSIRRPLLELLDDSDRKETARTKLLLETGLIGLGSAFAWTAVTRPVKCLLGAGLAFRLGARSGNRLRALSYLAQACLLRRWLAREGVSHLHTQIGTNTADVAMLCRKLGGPPFSFTVHGPAEFDRADALSIHDKIKSAAFVVAVSSFCRSQLFRHCTLADWSKIHVVRCAVDATFLDSATVPKTVALRMICIGRLAQQKGQLVLIEAVAGLRKAGVNFELVLVGDGPLRPQIEAAIAKCGVSSQVRITGWQNRDAVRNELVAATVLVMPSFAEGLPVELMEAMALGRPVVATYVAGIPELVQDGVNGWLVPAGDPAALTHVLTQALATGHDKLSEMGLAGISTLRTFHNASTEASKLVSLFSASAGRQSSVGGAS